MGQPLFPWLIRIEPGYPEPGQGWCMRTPWERIFTSYACSPRRRRPILSGALLCLILIGTLLPKTGRCADPQPYRVSFRDSGEGALDQALRDSSMLLALQDQPAVSPYALMARARADAERFRTALRSFGYYGAAVEIRFGDLFLNDPKLADRLVQAPASSPLALTVLTTTGPRYRLRQLAFRGSIPAEFKSKTGLKPGDPALAPDVLAARQRLLDALHNGGYGLAKVETPIATPINATHELDVVFPVLSGPKVALGNIDVRGLKRLDPEFVRRRLTLHPGDRFDPADIERNRRDLGAIGALASVRVRQGKELDAAGRLPVTIELTERPQHAVNLNAAFSTDLGGSFAATWQHRNLLGRAEKLNLSGGMTQLGGSSTRGIGYQAAVGFLKPDFRRRDQDLQADLGAIRQNLEAYDREAVTGDVLLNRRYGSRWTLSGGLSAEQEHIVQEGVSTDYTLLGLPLTAKYDGTDNPLEPTRGLRATASLTPLQPVAGPATRPFVLLNLAGSGYWDLAEPGRSVLALRGAIGDVAGASARQLPPDKRYYAGGGATVRGYAYQSLGPQFADGKPRGGSSMVAGTVEWRRRILDHYGIALFVDAGQVSASGAPFSGNWQFGAGLGLRYYTAIGPIRLDLAAPINRQAGGSDFQIYVGLGQAF